MTIRRQFAIPATRPAGGGSSIRTLALSLVIALVAAVPAAADSGVRVRLGDGIQTLPLERYVEGAVAGEVYADCFARLEETDSHPFPTRKAKAGALTRVEPH